MPLYYKNNFFEQYNKKYISISDEDLSMIIEHLPFFPRNGTLLDLACGSGIIGERLKFIFPKVTFIGTDICFPLIKWAKFPVCQSDAFHLSFHDNSFDCIIAAAAFHHFPHIEEVLRECSRCLKPNGVFLAYDPNKFHPQRFLMMTNPLRKIFYKTGDQAISPKFFQGLLLKENFRDILVSYLTFKEETSSFYAKLNYKIIDEISSLGWNWLLPILSPWFIISAVRR